MNRASETGDYRLPSEGTLHNHLFELYQTLDRIIEELRANFLATKSYSNCFDMEWESKMTSSSRSEASQILRF